MKLFRKIRHSLIGNKKVKSYLLYAFGEIVLVVIGILIALAINNSNQERTAATKEQTYLFGLKGEFEISRMKLKELIKVNQQNIDGAKRIIGFISEPEPGPDEQEFSKLLYRTFALDISFNPNTSLLEEMINSGSLKYLSNTELRVQLTDWLATLKDIEKQEQDLGLQREKTLDLFRSDDNSIRTVFKQVGIGEELNLNLQEPIHSNLWLLNSTAFDNNVLIFLLTSHATQEAHYRPLMQKISLILQMIDTELQQ